MNMAKNIAIATILVLLASCNENRTYLTEEEKGWNPYEKGQTLVFESREGILDSVFIEDVKYTFPDGLGVVDKFEILKVPAHKTFPYELGNPEMYLFTIHARTEKEGGRLQFGLSLKHSRFYSGYFDLEDDIKRIPETPISVPYGSFDDVIIVRDQRNHSDISNAIKSLYWSKSQGYVRYDKYNGDIWELKEIKSITK